MTHTAHKHHFISGLPRSGDFVPPAPTVFIAAGKARRSEFASV
jgi:hypothetical protein